MADEKLYNELKKEISKANSRLLALEKLTGKEYSWAGQKLYDKLSVDKLGAWKNGRIRITKEMSDDDLKRIASATKTFLSSKTSTVRGVKARAKSIKANFKSGIGVTQEQAEKIYQAFDEDIIKWALRYFDASELWALIQEAKEDNMSEQTFTAEFLKRAKIAGEIDADFSDLLHDLYSDEVKK